MNRYLQVLFVLFLSSMLCSCRSAGQITAPVQTFEGTEYFMHTVDKKQTMYALSKLYQIQMNDLLSANPGSDSGIKEGQIIKVPVKKSGYAKTNETSLLLHEVQRKETLFSIAQQHNVSVNDLTAANPGSDVGIKKGQMLRIPQLDKIKPTDNPKAGFFEHIVAPGETLYALSVRFKVKVDEIKTLNQLTSDSLREGMVLKIPSDDVKLNEPTEIVDEIPVLGGKKDHYGIALMLPFYAQFGDSSSMDPRDVLQREASLDIYRGILMALDSLEEIGLNADLYVYDVLDGRTVIDEILKKPEMKNVDLIIGPTFRDPLKEVSNYSTKYGVNVVCPTPQSTRVLLSAPNLCKASPSAITVMEELGEYVARTHKNDNVVLLSTKNLDDARAIQAFKEKYLAIKGDTALTEVITGTSSSSGLTSKLVSGKTNVVVVPSNDRLLISGLMNNLGNRSDVILYGTDDWQNMDIIGAEEREKLRIRFPAAHWVDYSNPLAINFVESFRSRFKKEPQGFAFTGYDIMMFYGLGLNAHGRGLSANFKDIPQEKLISLGFDYVKTGSENGSENSHIFIIGHEDYRLVIENK
ncbi:MAG: LysM peptidoglycan-binding domain-containing protein [Flavobacteriales bacterium]|nr:LysM peptidoglycan-binding domain-containing protein [Flavobacteriales bacterium]